MFHGKKGQIVHYRKTILGYFRGVGNGGAGVCKSLCGHRPEGAQDLAQGKAYSPPPWVTRHINHLAALKGQDTAVFSCPVGAAECYRDIHTQGGAALPIGMTLALG